MKPALQKGQQGASSAVLNDREILSASELDSLLEITSYQPTHAYQHSLITSDIYCFGPAAFSVFFRVLHFLFTRSQVWESQLPEVKTTKNIGTGTPRSELPGVRTQKLWMYQWEPRQRRDWAGQPMKRLCLNSGSHGLRTQQGSLRRTHGSADETASTFKYANPGKKMRPSYCSSSPIGTVLSSLLFLLSSLL